MPIKQEIANSFTGEWQVGLFETPVKAPTSFLYGCCCSCCMAGQQRGEILQVIGEPYVCCGGLFPCGPLGEPQDENCKWAEACCCTGCAISANRFLIQTRFDRMNTPCDECILWTVCIVSWVVCILQIFIDVPDEIENLVDCLIQVVNGCMLAQQQVEIDHVKKNGFQINQAVMGMLPPHQQQMIAQGKPSFGQSAAFAVGAAVGGGAGGAVAYGKPRPAR